MHSKLSKLFMATGAAAALATSAIPRPAAADTTSTMETLLGAAAVIGGIVISNNIRNKQAQANQVVGYTANGGTVYADGRIVMPNGQTYYPNANGQNQIAQYGYDNGYNPNSYGYSTNPNGYLQQRGQLRVLRQHVRLRAEPDALLPETGRVRPESSGDHLRQGRSEQRSLER